MLRLHVACFMLCVSGFPGLAQDRFITPSQAIPFDSMDLERPEWLKALAFRLSSSVSEQDVRAARTYYFFVLAQISEHCDLGMVNVSRINKGVLGYDLFDYQGAAEGGFEILGDILEQLASGNAAGFLTGLAVGEELGRRDGERIAGHSGCGPATFDLVEAGVRFLELSRDGAVADELMNPVVVEIKEAERAHGAFSEACVDRYADDSFCQCLVHGLDQVPLTRTEWISIGQDFSGVLTIGGRNPLVIGAAQGCLP